MRALATYLLRGNKEAIIVVLVCSFLALIIPVFGLFNAVIIGLVSLRVGTNAGLILSGISSVVIITGIMMLGVMPEQSKGIELVAIVQWTVSLFGLVALCALLRTTRSLQLSMLSALGAGVAAIVGFRLVVSDTVAWWQHSTFKEFYNRAIESVMAQQQMVDHQMMESVSANLVGLFVATFIASIFIHLYLARGWQAAMFNPGGFRDEFSQLSYGKKTAGFALACLVMFMALGAENFMGFVGMATVMLMGMMYTIAGIAVITGVFKAKNWHWSLVIGATLVFLVFSSIALKRVDIPLLMVVMIFSIIGFVDTFLNFRKKVQQSTGE